MDSEIRTGTNATAPPSLEEQRRYDLITSGSRLSSPLKGMQS